MSRYSQRVNEHTTFHIGSDHALGRFKDITDSRYAAHPSDQQGEGFVFEYSELFGIGTNLIGASHRDVLNNGRLIELTNKFIESLS